MGKLFICELNILPSLPHQPKTKATDVFGMNWAFGVFNGSITVAAQVQAVLFVTCLSFLENERKELGLNFFGPYLFGEVEPMIIDLKIELAPSYGAEPDEVSFNIDSRGFLWAQLDILGIILGLLSFFYLSNKVSINFSSILHPCLLITWAITVAFASLFKILNSLYS